MHDAGEQPPHLFSKYPALPPPIDVRLTVLSDHDCPYLPDRQSRSRAIYAPQMPARVYHAFMDAGFRRSGRVVYQPICSGCRECRPLRVPVDSFEPSKSQRRCRRKNSDIFVEIGEPVATDESFALYQRYQRDWHGKADEPIEEAREGFEQFLYASPVPSIEFKYRDRAGKLLAVGICDVTPMALSSVYFYFDTEEARRGLGTFGALRELDYARQQSLVYYYLGFWIAGCGAMQYKTAYRPYEILREDGVWVREGTASND